MGPRPRRWPAARGPQQEPGPDNEWQAQVLVDDYQSGNSLYRFRLCVLPAEAAVH